jgi:hypothetical protein
MKKSAEHDSIISAAARGLSTPSKQPAPRARANGPIGARKNPVNGTLERPIRQSDVDRINRENP